MSQAPGKSPFSLNPGPKCSSNNRRIPLYLPESTLSFNLRNFMRHREVNDTKSLVDACNKTENEDEKNMWLDWFLFYVHWVEDPNHFLEADHWREYLELGTVKYDPKNQKMKDFWLKWFQSISQKVEQPSPSIEVVESLEVALRLVPPEIFISNLSPLTKLENRLFEILDPKKQALVKENYSALRPALVSLYQVFALMQKTAKRFIDPTQQYYKKVLTQLNEIKKEQCYFPIYVLTCLIEQTFSQIEDAKLMSLVIIWLGRGWSGAKAAIHLNNVITKTAKLDIDLDELQSLIDSIKALLEQRRVMNPECYASINILNGLAMLVCRDSRVYDKYWTEATKMLEKYPANSKRVYYRKAVRVSVIDQLQLITSETKDIHIQQRAFNWLLSLGNGNKKIEWLRDADTHEAMLDALGHVYAVVENKSQVIDLLNSMDTIDDNKVSERYKSWLGNFEKVEDRLSTFVHVSNDADRKDRIFLFAKKKMSVYTKNEVDKIQAELRESYRSDKFTMVNSLFDEEEPLHVQDFEFHIVKYEYRTIREAQNTLPDDTHDRMEIDSGLVTEDLEDRGLLHRDTSQCVVTKPIRIEELFESKPLDEEDEDEETQKVLLLGLPGTGKTSISKKLAFLWASREWGEEFDFVFLIEVRHLSKKEFKGNDLRSMPDLVTAVTKLCFMCEDNTKFSGIKSHIKNLLTESSTLLIVDGLDERAGSCDEIIKEAENCECQVLLTGRPHNLKYEKSIVSYEAECMGLTDDQVARLIKRKMPNEEDANTLMGLLKANPKVWYYAHIPVTANIVCSLWRYESESSSAESIFTCRAALYSKLTSYLWRRFSRDGHPNQDEKQLFYCLGNIAFKALQSGQIFISPRLIEHNASSALREKMKQSGFFLSRQEDNFYYFLHLTFQEYYAAWFLKESIIQKKDGDYYKAKEFIKIHNYNGRNQNVIRFFVEELAMSKEVTFEDLMSQMAEGATDTEDLEHQLQQLDILEYWKEASTEKTPILRSPCNLDDDIENKVKQILRNRKSDHELFRKIFEEFKDRKTTMKLVGDVMLEHMTDSDPEVRKIATLCAWTVTTAAPEMTGDVAHALLERMSDEDEDAEVCRNAARHAPEMAQKVPEIAYDFAKAFREHMNHSEVLVCRNAALYAPDMAKICQNMAKICQNMAEDYQNMAEDYQNMAEDIANGFLGLIEHFDSGVRDIAKNKASDMKTIVPAMEHKIKCALAQ